MDDNETYMFPNLNYFIYFKEGKVEEIVSTQEFSNSVSFGLHSNSELILEKIGINKILKDVFGNKSELIKALVNYYLSNENNTIQGFKYWLFKNYAGLEKIYSESYISNLLNSQLTSEKIYKFQSEWYKTYKKLNGENIKECYIYVDSTNISST